MDIILGYGFDDIRFGMLESEIITKLGLPDKKYESSYDLHLEYFSLRCDLWLLKKDSKLHWIRTSNSGMRIFGELMLNQKKDKLISFLSSKLDDELEINDYGEFESYTFKKTWLELQFQFDILIEIGFGHF